MVVILFLKNVNLFNHGSRM